MRFSVPISEQELNRSVICYSVADYVRDLRYHVQWQKSCGVGELCKACSYAGSLECNSKMENHMVGSWLQIGGARKVMLAVMVLPSSSDMATNDAVATTSL